MPSLHVAQIIDDTEAEGPGHRFAVWVQGCPLRCPGCCNPHMLPFRGGAEHDPVELAARVLDSPAEGVTVLGGEPFSQPEAVGELCEGVRRGGKSTLVFTGYTLAELQAMRSGSVDALIGTCDLIVDGRYERTQPEAKRRWIGSSNQVMHFLTDRYSPADPQFTAPNTFEVRLSAGTLQINGWPAAGRQLRVPHR